MIPPPQPLAENAAATALRCAGSTVFYDGSCPLCQKEISLYRSLRSTQPINWVDVSKAGYCAPKGTTVGLLMGRFHAVTPAGELISGAKAFAHVWSQLPGWRMLAALAKLPGALFFLEVAYRLFLPLRPLMQRMARRLER